MEQKATADGSGALARGRNQRAWPPPTQRNIRHRPRKDAAEPSTAPPRDAPPPPCWLVSFSAALMVTPNRRTPQAPRRGCEDGGKYTTPQPPRPPSRQGAWELPPDNVGCYCYSRDKTPQAPQGGCPAAEYAPRRVRHSAPPQGGLGNCRRPPTCRVFIGKI